MRLRCAASAALACLASRIAPAAGTPAAPPPVVLVRASVADRARSVMPPALWLALVGTYAGTASTPLADDATADAAGCLEAGGDYLVIATFDVRSDLPGLANASDRVAGRSHLRVLACNDGRFLADRTLRLDGEPLAPAEAGTPEALASAWRAAVAAAFANAGVAVGRITRGHRLDSGGNAFHIDFLIGGVKPGAVVSDVARPNRTPRHDPISLGVVTASGASADALAAPAPDGRPAPGVGDVIEFSAPA